MVLRLAAGMIDVSSFFVTRKQECPATKRRRTPPQPMIYKAPCHIYSTASLILASYWIDCRIRELLHHKYSHWQYSLPSAWPSALSSTPRSRLGFTSLSMVDLTVGLIMLSALFDTPSRPHLPGHQHLSLCHFVLDFPMDRVFGRYGCSAIAVSSDYK